ncbi:unnamed protein product [Closterium sp. NIES-54]
MDCKFMENLMYKDWKAENEAKIGVRFGEVKSSGLEHVELPLELRSGCTTTRQYSIVNGGEEAKDAEEEEEEVQQVTECAPTLPSRTTIAPRIRITPQQRHESLHVPAGEEEGRGKRRIQATNRLTYVALGKPAESALAEVAMMVGDDEESDYEEFAFAFFSLVEMPGEPATFKETLKSSDAEEWKKAMESELKSIEENGTWELVELSEGRKAITYKWLFKIKSNVDGKIKRYKSRLVAKGYEQKEKRSFMVVYVDDTLIFSPSSDLVKEVMLKLQDKFKCKALGDVSFYLGLHIERDVEKRCMRVHQRKYLEALAANSGQSEGLVATPFPSGFKCVKGPEEESVGEEERRRFHSLVAAGVMVAKYLGQTPTVGLQYSAAAQRRQKGVDGVEPDCLFLTAFSDASYALEPEDMTSLGGFILCVGGGPTAWESKKQVDQALSSMEFEYMALFRRPRRLDADLGVWRGFLGTWTPTWASGRASWASGRQPGRLEGVLGAWTPTWVSGRCLGRLDADLGAWTASWERGRRPGRLDAVLSTWTPNWASRRCPVCLDADLVARSTQLLRRRAQRGARESPRRLL